jgi:hypothetical protein
VTRDRALNLLVAMSTGALLFTAYRSAHNSWAFGRVTIIDSGHRKVVDLSDIHKISVTDIWSGELRPIRRPNTNTLAVFLSGAECADGVDEYVVWRDLALKVPRSRLDIVVVLIRVSADEARSVAKDLGRDLAIYWDQSGDLPARIHLPQPTPFKALLDANGRILLVDGPEGDKSAQQDFGRTVLSVLAKQESIR